MKLRGSLLSLLCFLQVQNESLIEISLQGAESFSLISTEVSSGSDRMDRRESTLNLSLSGCVSRTEFNFTYLFFFFWSVKSKACLLMSQEEKQSSYQCNVPKLSNVFWQDQFMVKHKPLATPMAAVTISLFRGSSHLESGQNRVNILVFS